MTLNRIVRTVLFLACGAASTSAQDLLETPIDLWSYQLLPQADLGPVEVQKGNGIFLDPSGRMAVVTTVGATVYAFNAYSGTEMWQYQTPVDGTNVASCHSAVTFSDLGYMTFSVVDNENSLTPTTRVIALDMDGNELWISDSLDGVPQGDPLVSSNGDYVFLIHNEFDQSADISTGHFTILEANDTGAVFYTEGTDDDVAFGPPGIYHMPVEGNYDPIIPGAPVSEGENNQNDFLMWSQTPKPTDTSIADGLMYGFQFPRTFSGNSSDVAYFELGDVLRDFQSTTPPVITNEGLSAYWGVSRSSYRGWNGKRFTRNRDVSIGFTRNPDFPGESVFAAPSLSNDGPNPIIFGGTASNEFIRMNIDFQNPVVVTTDDVIMSKSIVDGEERAVYYVERNGNLHQADVESLVDIWNYTVNFVVEGEMALTPNNDVLIVADRRGVIRALQVAEIAVTDSPSMFPSDMPSMAPSGEDTLSPTAAPVAPTASSPTTAGGTTAPSTAGQTETPVAFPTGPPSGAYHPSLITAAVCVLASLFF